MSDKRVDVEFGAKTEGIEKGAKDASKAVEGFKAQSEDASKKSQNSWASFGDTFKGIGNTVQDSLKVASGNFTQFGKDAEAGTSQAGLATVAAGAMIGTALTEIGIRLVQFIADLPGKLMDLVNATAEYNFEAMRLGRTMGISATDAGIWQTALADVGATQSELQTASRALSMKLRENEEDLNRMGVTTRSSNGELLQMNELMLSAIDTVNSYKEGTDRNAAAAEIFGRSVQGSSQLLLINQQVIADNTALMDKFGIKVGQENVDDWKAFDEASDAVNLGFKAMKVEIGNQLIPVFTKLGNWLATALPYAITIAKGAMGGWLTAWWAIKNGVVVVWEIINAMVVSVAEPLRALAAAMFKMSHGDFSGAWSEFQSAGKTIVGAWKAGMKEITESSIETKEKISNIWGQKTDAKGPSGEGSSFLSEEDAERSGKAPKAQKSAKEIEGPDSYMSTYQTKLDMLKFTYAEENNLREMNKQMEADYWQSILDNYDVTAKDHLTITMKINSLELASKRELQKNLEQLDTIRFENVRTQEMARIDAMQSAAQQELDLGIISKEQFLEQERFFISQRLAAEMKFIEDKIALAELDPDKNMVLLEQLEQQKMEIKLRYAAQTAELLMQTVQASQAPMQTIFKSLEDGIVRVGTTMLTNWRGVGAALKGVLTSIGTTIIQETILKPLAAKAAAWLKEKALSIASIGASAAKAGAGAAESQASIPYVGPILAIAAMAAIFAGVMGMSSKVPSAAGGFDIPRGLNPLTQLHAEEMVLPSPLANAVRRMAGGDQQKGAAGGDQNLQSNLPPMNFSISAVDARGVRDLLMDNQEALVAAMRGAQRNFIRGE